MLINILSAITTSGWILTGVRLGLGLVNLFLQSEKSVLSCSPFSGRLIVKNKLKCSAKYMKGAQREFWYFDL